MLWFLGDYAVFLKQQLCEQQNDTSQLAPCLIDNRNGHPSERLLSWVVDSSSRMWLVCGPHLFLLPPNKCTPTIEACWAVIFILDGTCSFRLSHDIHNFIWQADGRRHSFITCWEAELLGSSLPMRGRPAAYHSPQELSLAHVSPPPHLWWPKGNGYVIFRLVIAWCSTPGSMRLTWKLLVVGLIDRLHVQYSDSIFKYLFQSNFNLSKSSRDYSM